LQHARQSWQRSGNSGAIKVGTVEKEEYMFKKIVIVGLICLSFSSVALAGKQTIDPGSVTINSTSK